MSKDLPYFKFYVNSWLTGEITNLPYATQGVFTNIMAFYWSRGCNVSMSEILKKFPKKQVEKLIFADVLKKNGEKVVINFLNSQLNDKKSESKQNSVNGSKGGRSISYGESKKATALEYKSNIEERRGDKKREDIYISAGDKIFQIGTRDISEPVSAFFKSNCKIFYEQYLMKNGSTIFPKVLEEMDTNFTGYTFSDENHLINMFKKVYENIQSGKKSYTGTGTQTVYEGSFYKDKKK